MLTRPSFRPALVVGVVVVATAWFATRAGDLNPPKGPIQPTMVSLEDLYNRISTQGGCPTCAWDYKFIGRDTIPTGDGQVLVGSGVLHAIVMPGYPCAGAIRFYDTVYSGVGAYPRERTITELYTCRTLDVPPTTVVMDLRFTDGIFVSGASINEPGGVTLIYRLDP